MTHPESDERTAYWEAVYRQKAATSVSWYRAHLDVSLNLLEQAGLTAASRLIDVGGGASTLVDDLLDRGLSSVTVLDLSVASLDVARERLGNRAGSEFRGPSFEDSEFRGQPSIRWGSFEGELRGPASSGSFEQLRGQP